MLCSSLFQHLVFVFEMVFPPQHHRRPENFDFQNAVGCLLDILGTRQSMPELRKHPPSILSYITFKLGRLGLACILTPLLQSMGIKTIPQKVTFSGYIVVDHYDIKSCRNQHSNPSVVLVWSAWLGNLPFWKFVPGARWGNLSKAAKDGLVIARLYQW